MASTIKQRQAELALHRAIGSGDVEETSRLLSEGVDPNCIGDSTLNFKYAFTALCAAIQSVRHAHTQPKIDAASNEALPDMPVKKLDYAAYRANCIEIMKRLLAGGADPNRRTFSRTPLSLAAYAGDAEAVSLLLDAGASPAGECWSPFSDLPRPKGGLAFCNNAIHEATSKGYTDVVRVLCDRGADTSARDHQGKTALQIARKRGHKDIIHILERYERTTRATPRQPSTPRQKKSPH